MSRLTSDVNVLVEEVLLHHHVRHKPLTLHYITYDITHSITWDIFDPTSAMQKTIYLYMYVYI